MIEPRLLTSEELDAIYLALRLEQITLLEMQQRVLHLMSLPAPSASPPKATITRSDAL